MTQEPAAARGAAPAVPMTAEQRGAFERDGYLIIRGALCPDEVTGVRDAVDRVYAAMAKAGFGPVRVNAPAQRGRTLPGSRGLDRPSGHVRLCVVDPRLEHSRLPLSP